MTFEMRTYTSTEGRMEDLLTRFRDHTLQLFTEHGIQSLGYWHPVDQDDVLVYLVQHEGDPEANWEAFRTDPRWLKARAASTENGEIVAGVESVYLKSTDFSPLR
ncbi:NIPSNAP family protein [Arthrobacter ramosus]|nr:NIPSNAP family protein [Arthrobacter ramosus]